MNHKRNITLPVSNEDIIRKLAMAGLREECKRHWEQFQNGAISRTMLGMKDRDSFDTYYATIKAAGKTDD